MLPSVSPDKFAVDDIGAPATILTTTLCAGVPSLKVTLPLSSDSRPPTVNGTALAVAAPIAAPPLTVSASAAGSPRSWSSVKVSEAEPVLPAVSVSLATTVCGPSDRLGVKLQVPPALAVAVPNVETPSLNVTTAVASPPPVRASFDVILSLEDDPVSDTRLSVTAGGVVSSVKVSEAEPVKAKALVSLATMVCGPSDRLGVKLQVPPELAVA